MQKILIIVAAGNSSRMGGKPKALADFDGAPVITNTINNAQSYFNQIVVVSNEQNYDSFQETVKRIGLTNISVIQIKSGFGDADAVLKAVLCVKSQIGGDFDATFCWGDAIFTSSQIFDIMLQQDVETTFMRSLIVGCSIDTDPYAYFDVYTENGDFEKMLIKQSYFQKLNGHISIGVHDQCIFRAYTAFLIEALRSYQLALGYDGENYALSNKNEMGLLNSFSFLHNKGVSCVVRLLPSGNVYSFNTVDELEKIRHKLLNR